jgi:DNA repair protein RecO (recombination protein O)
LFRTSVSQAIVLKTYGIGETHKGVVFLSRESGLMEAMAYGAKQIKSRLRSLTEVFSISRFYLYQNPVKQKYKITDAEMIYNFEGLRQNLKRYYTASLWAEIILKSFAGGEQGHNLFDLLQDSLIFLNNCQEDKIDYVSLFFMWHFILISGFKPDLNRCGACDRMIGGQMALFLPQNSLFLLCPSCSSKADLVLNPGSRMYLSKIADLPLREGVKIKLDNSGLIMLKKLLYTLLEKYLETQLKSVHSSGGIL